MRALTSYLAPALIAATPLLVPGLLAAQDEFFEGREIVPRVGATLGHEQVTLGVGLISPGVADITYLEFRPGVDLGFGDDRTTLRASANMGYAVPASGGEVRVSPLVGVSVIYESREFSPGDGSPTRSESETDLGLNLGVAADSGDLIFEAIIGFGGIPDISVSVGIGIG